MSSKNLGLILFGLAAGVGIGLFLNSEKGKEMRSNTLEDVKDLESRIEEKVEEALNKMKSKVNNAASRVQKATKN